MMRSCCRLLATVALSIAWVAIPLSTTGTLVSATKDFSGEGHGIGLLQVFQPFIGPEIAHTELFRSQGLSYVHSRDFAESLCAVAAGRSPFSPDPVPSRWKVFAAAWKGSLRDQECTREDSAPGTEDHLAPAHDPPDAGPPSGILSGSSHRVFSEWLNVPGGDDGEIPALLFRASLEFRTRPGRENTRPVLPFYVRMASDHSRRLLAKQWEKYKAFGMRGMEIASKIVRAEQGDAQEKAFRSFALARTELYRARYVASASYYTIRETEDAFAQADEAADSLERLGEEDDPMVR